MAKQLHLIYIPGLGDDKPRFEAFQRWAVKTWRLWGVEAEYFPANWSSDEPWAAKLQRFLGKVDEAGSQSQAVGLVGNSAGATLAITAFAARLEQAVGVVLIAGKANLPQALNPVLVQRNPALKPAVQASEAAVQKLSPNDRQRIQTRSAIYDEVVTLADSRVPGADNRRVLGFGHVPTNVTQITLGTPGFIRFLRRQAKIK